MKPMIAFAAVVALIAGSQCVSAAGRSAMNAYGALTPFDTPSGVMEGSHVSAKRTSALQQCNAVAARYSQTSWGIRQTQVYRACMARRGEPE